MNKKTEEKVQHQPAKSVPILSPTIDDHPSNKLSAYSESPTDSDKLNNQTTNLRLRDHRSKSLPEMNNIQPKTKHHRHSPHSTESLIDKDLFIRIHGPSSATPIDYMSGLSQENGVNYSSHHEMKTQNITSFIPDNHQHQRSQSTIHQRNAVKKSTQKKLSLMASYLSTALFLLGYFLASQPYNASISNYSSNPSNWIKLATVFVFIILMLFSVSCTWQSYKHKPMPPPKPSCCHREKWYHRIILGSLMLLISAETLVMTQCFYTNSALQYLTPLFFGLSYFFLMIQCSLSKKTWLPKIGLILFCCLVTVGNVSILLDTINKVPSFIGSHAWSEKVLPIILLISLFSSAIIVLSPFFNQIKNYLRLRKSNQHKSSGYQIPSFIRDSGIHHKGSKIFVEYADESPNKLFMK